MAFLCGGGGKPPCPAGSGTITGTIIAADVIELIAARERGAAHRNRYCAGVPPVQRLNACRKLATSLKPSAAAMSSTSSREVDDIAAALGFTDVASFRHS